MMTRSRRLSQSLAGVVAFLFLSLVVTGCRRPADASQANRPEANVIAILEKDLASVDEQIRNSEDDMIEYMRLHDVKRVQIFAEGELQELRSIVAERFELKKDVLVLEATYPSLADTNASIHVEDSVRVRHDELERKMTALEMAVHQWKGKNALAMARDSELKHLQDKVRRLEEIYSQLAQRLHDLRMKEQLKSLQSHPPGQTSQ